MTSPHYASADPWAESGRRCREFSDTLPTEPGALDASASCSGACRRGRLPCPTRQACGLPTDADGRGAIAWPLGVGVAIGCALALAWCSGPIPAPV